MHSGIPKHMSYFIHCLNTALPWHYDYAICGRPMSCSSPSFINEIYYFCFFKDHLKIQCHKLSTVRVAFSRNCVEEPSRWKHWDPILSSLRDASRAILLLLDNNAIWVWGKISTSFRRGEEWLDIDDSEWEPSDAGTRIQQPSHGTLHSSELQPQPKHADPDTPEPSHALTHSTAIQRTVKHSSISTRTDARASPAHIRTPHTSTPCKRLMPPVKKTRTHTRKSFPTPILTWCHGSLNGQHCRTYTVPTHNTHHPYTHSTPNTNFTPVVEVHAPKQDSKSPPALTPQASNITPIATPFLQTQPLIITPEVCMATLDVQALSTPHVAATKVPKNRILLR